MSDWRDYSLGDIGKVITGKTPKTKIEGNFGEEYMFITPRDMNGQKYVRSTERGLSELGLNSVLKNSIPENSVCVSCIGSDMGKVVLSTYRSVTNQQINSLIVKDHEVEFVYYNLLLRQDEIKSGASGSAVPIMNKTTFSQLRITLPPLSEQKAIAHILGKLDDKIEINRKMNQTLEAMAQALFKSWFVDFDPVMDNALAADHKTPPALQAMAEKRKMVPNRKKLLSTNPELAGKFPSSFVFNETLDKWIPDGWEVKNVESAINVNPKVTIKKGELAKSVDMKALPTSGYSVDGIIIKEYNGGAKFKNGDILLARITPCLENGKTAIVDFLKEDEIGFGSTEFIVLRGREDIRTPFVACLARHEAFVNHCIQNMVGSSGRQRVQNSCFNSYYLALPKNELLLSFDSITASQFDKMTENSAETQTLTQLRDTLLPQLISGKVRVPEIQKIQV